MLMLVLDAGLERRRELLRARRLRERPPERPPERPVDHRMTKTNDSLSTDKLYDRHDLHSRVSVSRSLAYYITSDSQHLHS